MTMTYDELIETKLTTMEAAGFEPSPFKVPLFDWQGLIVQWAVRRGRACIFADCGLGKTAMQLEWARQVTEYTGRPVIVLCPLAVAAQTVAEGQRFGVNVTLCRHPEDVQPGVNITNYQRIEAFDCGVFSGVVLDESSILKSFDGKTRVLLTEKFKETPYRLACTATPAPNDFTELGQHAEFMGAGTAAQMLATYFINDTFDTGTWRIKGHAQVAFWSWVSSWAACISKPSDIGFSDEGFILPPVDEHNVVVPTDQTPDATTGTLFRMAPVSATELHSENRRTLKARVNAAAEIVNGTTEAFIVWCASNEESTSLAEAIPDAVEVYGSLSVELKEERIRQFVTGEKRVLVTKGKITGFGLNFQHCRNEIYLGLNHSFETFYQCCRRIWRFGQRRKVNRYIVQTDNETGVMAALDRKGENHEAMRDLVRFTRDNLTQSESKVILNRNITTASEGDWTLHNGDCVRVAATIPDNSIGFTVFSPPFADLFTYSADVQDMGNCKGQDDFMRQFGFLVDELIRITMPGRLCAVHCLSLLAAKWKDGEIELKDFDGDIVRAFRSRGWLYHSRVTIWKSPVTEMQRTKAHGLLYKTLKKDSSCSRVGNPEYLLVFKKRGENPKPITHTEIDMPLNLWQEIASPVWMTVDQCKVLNGKFATEQADERHICPLQLDVIERALHLWSAPGDLVFSPFSGIGSEGYQSLKMGRKFVGSELKQSYWKTACDYLRLGVAERGSLF